MRAPLPSAEQDRLAALRRLDVLDTLPEDALDDLTALAAHVCGAPIALISFIDEHRQWIKSRFGLDVDETPRIDALCAHAILQPGLFIVPDASLDARFADNPLVTGDPHIRFYAGVPLVTANGHALGTLCVIDREPRELRPEQLRGLRVLGHAVMTHLELRWRGRVAVQTDPSSRLQQLPQAPAAPQSESESRTRHTLLHLLEDQQHTLATLRQSEQQLRFVSDHVPVLIAQCDREQRFVFANKAYADFFGRTITDIIGCHVHELLSDDVYQEILPNIDTVLAGQPIVFDRNLGGSNYPRIFNLSYVPDIDDSGQVMGFFAVIVDITKRKAAELKLQAREAQLSLILDNIGDIVFLIDVSNGNTFHFAAVSLSFLITTGLREDQVVGLPAENVLPEESHAQVFGKYREAIQNRSTVYWEEIAEYPSGSRTGEITLTPIFDGDGHCTQLVGTIHDVSAIRAALREIRQLNVELEARVLQRTSELQFANQELEAFSYSVSHDLRAPLRAITGFSEILATRHRANLNAQGQRYLDNIVEASMHMGHLIDDLLNYARLGRSTIHLRALSLADILAPILVHLEARAAIVGAEILVDPLPRVVGQPSLLTQVFSNLLDNALAYRKPGVAPRIRVSSRPVDDHRVEILVSDNGLGIAPELHEKVFQVFQRLHSQETHPGTGIGLAIVRKAVELMGGSIRLTSEPGVGSTFAFTLPLEPNRVE